MAPLKSDSAKRRTTADRITDALIADISAGLLEPGERLDEVSLAQRFGASRTPVREALGRLVARRVLVQGVGNGDGRSVRVASYSKAELSQMFEAMEEMEAVCAKLAAQRLNLLTESAILQAMDDMEKAAEDGDRHRFLSCNEVFHARIYEATQNQYVAEMAATFRYRTGPFRARRYKTRADMLQSIEPHRQLVEIILGRTPAEEGTVIRRQLARDMLVSVC
ncbi:MAG: GntR family transcriptional regulator [Pseudomonadota bacterium]